MNKTKYTVNQIANAIKNAAEQLDAHSGMTGKPGCYRDTISNILCEMAEIADGLEGEIVYSVYAELETEGK
jgi:hypothetical protein